MTDNIWEETINEEYYCSVEQLNPKQGELTIIKDRIVILRQLVDVTYGDVFGPDISDTDHWHQICVDFIG